MAQTVKNPPKMWETWVSFLGWEDPQMRAWQPTTLFLSGEAHGQRSLVSYSPWGPKSQTRLSDWAQHDALSNPRHYTAVPSWPLMVFVTKWCLTGGPVVEDSPAKAGDTGLTPGWGTKSVRAAEQRSPGATARAPACRVSGPRVPRPRPDTAE